MNIKLAVIAAFVGMVFGDCSSQQCQSMQRRYGSNFKCYSPNNPDDLGCCATLPGGECGPKYCMVQCAEIPFWYDCSTSRPPACPGGSGYQAENLYPSIDNNDDYMDACIDHAPNFSDRKTGLAKITEQITRDAFYLGQIKNGAPAVVTEYNLTDSEHRRHITTGLEQIEQNPMYLDFERNPSFARMRAELVGHPNAQGIFDWIKSVIHYVAPVVKKVVGWCASNSGVCETVAHAAWDVFHILF